VSGSASRILTAYRDDGYWTQLLAVFLWKLTSWPRGPWPPRGFVGQVSSSFRGSELVGLKKRRIQLSRLASTEHAQLWRLICVWETSQPASRLSGSGSLSRNYSRAMGRAGEAISKALPTSITSIFRGPLCLDRDHRKWEPHWHYTASQFDSELT